LEVRDQWAAWNYIKGVGKLHLVAEEMSRECERNTVFTVTGSPREVQLGELLLSCIAFGVYVEDQGESWLNWYIQSSGERSRPQMDAGKQSVSLALFRPMHPFNKG
jgi:hypothetical protein